MVNEKITAAEENLLHVYNRFQVAWEHGEGMYLYDTEGKKYLDFAAGIAVTGLGYGNKKLNEAMKGQIDKIWHISNLYYHENCGMAAKALNEACGMDRVFFTNSGTEAIEGALKAARKYAYTLTDAKRPPAPEGHALRGALGHTKESGRFEFIAMEDSFHGRSIGALSVTGTKSYREPFEPLLPTVHFARYNDLDSVKALVNEKTCAIILEPLQGEGGIHPATREFMEGIRAICDEQDILMICDEIQCGMGRTGSMFAWQEYGVKPDILTLAKAIGNGFPVGAFAMTEKVAEYSMKAGDHGSTYGGNPLACMAVKTVLEIFAEENIVEHVREVAPYLSEKLQELAQKYDCIKECRGKGLIQGIELKPDKKVGEVIQKALDGGLVLISAKGNTIRFVPPLIVEKEHIDEMIQKLEIALR